MNEDKPPSCSFTLNKKEVSTTSGNRYHLVPLGMDRGWRLPLFIGGRGGVPIGGFLHIARHIFLFLV